MGCIGISISVCLKQLHRCIECDILSNHILAGGASGTFRRRSDFTRDWSIVRFADCIRSITLQVVPHFIGGEVSPSQVLVRIR
jgi:hypothetical protein